MSNEKGCGQGRGGCGPGYGNSLIIVDGQNITARAFTKTNTQTRLFAYVIGMASGKRVKKLPLSTLI